MFWKMDGIDGRWFIIPSQLAWGLLQLGAGAEKEFYYGLAKTVLVHSVVTVPAKKCEAVKKHEL